MSVLKRTALTWLACTGAALAIVMGAAPAAESKPPTTGELLAGCAQRVDELESEVEVLRAELARERTRNKALDSNVARFDDASVVSTRNVPECTVPFQISRAGIKRFKHQCLEALQAASPCDIPFEIDAEGLKRFKPHCL